MKSVSAELKNHLMNSHMVKARARLVAEWNHNRFTPIQSIDTWNKSQGVEAFDPDVFPISSIVEPLRPHRSGLIKARAGTSSSNAEGFIAPEYGSASGKKYYVSGPDDVYQYWCSPHPSRVKIGATPGTGYYFPYSQQPTVMYEYKSLTNKIMIKFENSFASPVKWRIRTTETEGAGWTTIATDVSVPSSGVVQLYRQADGSWDTTLYRDNPVEIDGLQILVESINKLDSYLNVIELSARYEMELTDYLVDYDYNSTMSDTNFITPIGKLSANEATIRLDNTTGLFNRENTNGIVPDHRRFIDKNVKFTGFVYYDEIPDTLTTTEGMRIFTVYSDEWAGQGEEIASIQCKDFSMYLQTIYPPKVMYQDLSVAEIVWRLCDLIGFTEYTVEATDRSADQKIPYFWTDGEQTIWEIFGELAESTQTAIYFDEQGFLQIKDRGKITGQTEVVDWALSYNKVGDKLPEIVDLNTNFDFEANVVKVKYQTTSVKKLSNGMEKTEVVWEPEGTTTLRSSNLTNQLPRNEHDRIYIPAADAKVWPYSGLVNINSELIAYEGKGYYWWEDSNTRRHSWVVDDAAKKKLDDETPDSLRYKNAFSGQLVNLTRGMYNTDILDHRVDNKGYYCRYTAFNTTACKVWDKGWTLNPIQGYAQLATNNTFSPNNTYVATRGSSHDKIPTRYGTRLRFPKGKSQVGAAGIAFSVGTNDCGFYVELLRTAYASKVRSYHNEIVLWSRKPGGAMIRASKGVVAAINEDTWYNLDVYFRVDSNDVRSIWITLNGVVVLTWAWGTGHSFNNSLAGRFGVFVRGYTTAQFEYLYASRDAEVPEIGETAFVDMINGGYTTKPFPEWTYKYYGIQQPRGIATIVTSRPKTAQVLFDEFAPVVHEVRESEVTFDKAPVLHSTPYVSNEGQALVTDYVGNPFGAKLTVANTSRNNAVIHGEDNLTFGPDNSVDQKFLIYGSTVTQDDEKEYVVRNHNAIRVRGEVVAEISSKWIQSLSFAKNLATWVANHWSQGNDEVRVTIFGNPLFQLMDAVTVNWPDRHMSPSTHKYYVVGIDHNWSNGLETTLTLRRAKFTTLKLVKPHYTPAVA